MKKIGHYSGMRSKVHLVLLTTLTLDQRRFLLIQRRANQVDKESKIAVPVLADRIQRQVVAGFPRKADEIVGRMASSGVDKDKPRLLSEYHHGSNQEADGGFKLQRV